MSFVVLTDTSANIPTDVLKENQIRVIPYTYRIGEKEFSCMDTEGFDGKKFYKAMRLGADIKTSQINPTAYEEFFEPFLKEGEDILFISMSSGISGSYHSAETAADELRKKYQERKICLVDSLGASLGEGLLVLKAVDYLRRGKSLEEVCRTLEEVRHRMYQVFTVDDLMYLKKTGRITGSSAIVGNMLQIKPLLKGNENGEIVNFGKVIGRRKAIDSMAQKYHQLARHPERYVVGIAHADCEKDAEYLAALIIKKNPPKAILSVMYEPVTGSHVGPGTLALFFMGADDVRTR